MTYTLEPTGGARPSSSLESSQSAVLFGPIIAGALAASAVALVLGLVGTGMGFVVATASDGALSAVTKFASTTAISLVVIEWLSSGVGGYVTGRLRARWASVHDDEVFFRDTVHGFLGWCIATLVAVGMLASAFTSVLGVGASAASNIAGQAARGAASNSSLISREGDYWVDELMRSNQASVATPPDMANDARAQLGRIVAREAAGQATPEDKDYAAQLIARTTGASVEDSRKRVDTVSAQIDSAKQAAADALSSARKVAATTSLMAALALIVGAFIASAAAALGGHRRDE